jgi:DNA-binding beta-propeller fold protein YncE
VIPRFWVLTLALAMLFGSSLLGQRVSRRVRKGDGGLATKAEINGPTSIAPDAEGNLYVFELAGGSVRRIDAATGIVTTILEECNEPWRNLLPAGCIPPISELRIDRAGNLLFSEFTYNRLSTLDPHSRGLSVIAGTGDLHSGGDGGRAIDAGITIPYCFGQDGEGNMFICDSSSRIRRVSAETGTISSVAGSGHRGFGGDGGTALDAKVGNLLSLAVDRSGNLHVADDTSNRIRRIDASTGIIETIAGSAPPDKGSSTFARFVEFAGEDGPATKARFNSPHSLTFDPAGNLIFAILGRVCRIDKQGYIRTIAGDGHEGFTPRSRSGK